VTSGGKGIRGERVTTSIWMTKNQWALKSLETKKSAKRVKSGREDAKGNKAQVPGTKKRKELIPQIFGAQ